MVTKRKRPNATMATGKLVCGAACDEEKGALASYELEERKERRT